MVARPYLDNSTDKSYEFTSLLLSLSLSPPTFPCYIRPYVFKHRIRIIRLFVYTNAGETLQTRRSASVATRIVV